MPWHGFSTPIAWAMGALVILLIGVRIAAVILRASGRFKRANDLSAAFAKHTRYFRF
jgi:hypothetical protein